MNRFKKPLLTAGVLVGLALIGSLMNSRPSAVQGAEAGPTVTIDPKQLPLPVTGNVQITGTPTISFSNTASSPLYTRDVDNPARRPFQTRLCFTVSFGQPASSCGSLTSQYAVPSDRRLVVEFVSGFCSTGPVGGTALTLIRTELSTSVSGTTAGHNIPLTAGLGHFDAAQQTRIYADPGTNVNLGSSLSGGSTPSSALCEMTVSGYTITP